MELVESAPDSFIVHNGNACQLTFDLSRLLRPPRQQSKAPEQHPIKSKAELASRKRSQSALEAEFSGRDIEEQLSQCGEVIDEAFYARWLHVKGGQFDAAKQAIIEHAQWRASTTPGGVSEVCGRTDLALQAQECAAVKLSGSLDMKCARLMADSLWIAIAALNNLATCMRMLQNPWSRGVHGIAYGCAGEHCKRAGSRQGLLARHRL